jgi:hypothetical protein
MKEKIIFVIIDADSMIYIIGSELEHLQLGALGIMKLDEFISDILVTIKRLLRIHRRRRCSKSISLLLSPTKGPRRKPEWFVFWQPIGPKPNDRTPGTQPADNTEIDRAANPPGNTLKYSKITIKQPP